MSTKHINIQRVDTCVVQTHLYDIIMYGLCMT